MGNHKKFMERGLESTIHFISLLLFLPSGIPYLDVLPKIHAGCSQQISSLVCVEQSDRHHLHHAEFYSSGNRHWLSLLKIISDFNRSRGQDRVTGYVTS